MGRDETVVVPELPRGSAGSSSRFTAAPAEQIPVVDEQSLLPPLPPTEPQQRGYGQPQAMQVKSVDQPASSSGTVTHTVQPKESLYGISKKYDVTVDNLKKWNNLTSDNLHIGQQLIISK